MSKSKTLYKSHQERDAVELAKTKKVGDFQAKLAKQNKDFATVTAADEQECQKIVDACQEIDAAIEKADYVESMAESRALDNMQEMLELQQRLDAVNAGGDVQIVVKVAPREPEVIMQDARQLHIWLGELQDEYTRWEALQPKMTAH